MLADLSALELGRLRMSVGYGSHKKGRLLSPIEVAELIRRVCDAGISREDCAKAINLDKSSIGRFLRILDLPADFQHLVTWGANKDSIGFSSAAQLARFKDAEDQRSVARSILVDGLNSKEIQQVAQLWSRSGKEIGDCLREVLGMRPVIEKRHLFIGKIDDQNVKDRLSNLTQLQRDVLLRSGINALDLTEVSGRLGKHLFTLVGSDSFGATIREVGADNLEEQMRSQIRKGIDNAQHSS